MLHSALAALLGLCLVHTALPQRLTDVKEEFKVYWNIPLNKCPNKKLFDLGQFNIFHNPKNALYGDQVNIFYWPGVFPYYKHDGTPLNGGLPQRGDLSRHITKFTKKLLDVTPDGFRGLSVIDFEEYLPAYNGYVGRVGRTAAREWVRQNFPRVKDDKKRVEQIANVTFEVAVEAFFKSLLEINRRLYPEALVGYYKFPRCNNWDVPLNACKQEVVELNDRLHGVIFNESTALFPSVYARKEHHLGYMDFITTKLDETIRININNLPVYSYYWYKYHDKHGTHDTYISDEEAIVSLWALKAYGTDGVVLWGFGRDLNSEQECSRFKTYVDGFLGPLLKCLSEMSAQDANRYKSRLPVFSGPGAAPLTAEMNATFVHNRKMMAAELRTRCGLAPPA